MNIIVLVKSQNYKTRMTTITKRSSINQTDKRTYNMITFTRNVQQIGNLEHKIDLNTCCL